MSSSTSLVVIEPVVAKVKVKSSPGGSRGMGDILPELPPLPREEELFTPPREREVTRKVDMRVTVKMLMMMMSREGKSRVEVDKMSMLLDISKDKMYLICNVLEGLRLMLMKGRNVYEWQGKALLIPTMMMLKKMAEKEDIMGQLVMASKLVANSGEYDQQHPAACSRIKEPEKLNVVMTTQKVMMMFLVTEEPNILPLDEMSIIIHGTDLTKLKRAMSIRRLNDICKILAGVGLVEVELQDDENSYKYIGPEVPKLAIVNSNEDLEEKMVDEIPDEMLEEITAVENILEDEKEVVIV